jgi:putative flippase GtrA
MPKQITKYLNWNVARWFMVGCATFAIDYVIFLSLYPNIGSVAITNLISGAVSTSFNYLAHHSWTFESDAEHRHSTLRYGGAMIFSYVLNTVATKTLLLVGAPVALAKFMAAVIQAPVTYVILNHWVFKKDNQGKSESRAS